MPLREELERDGRWLFRRRSWLPLVLVVALFAVLATGAPAMTPAPVWEIGCVVVTFLGLLVRVLTLGFVAPGTSGRSTDTPYADQLNATGMYSVVRHPLYLGNYLMWLGVAAWIRSWPFILIITLGYWIYYERIMFAEEAYLRRTFGEAWEAWAEGRPAFIPDLRRWASPEGRFSWKIVLKREPSGILAAVTLFAALAVTRDSLGAGALVIPTGYAILFGAGAAFFLIDVALIKLTKVLQG